MVLTVLEWAKDHLPSGKEDENYLSSPPGGE